MGVYRKQDAWWIDWYEGRRRCRKKTPAKTKTEAKKLLQKVKAKMLPRELGLFDPKLSCAELVTRHLEALKGSRAARSARSSSRASFAGPSDSLASSSWPTRNSAPVMPDC